MPFVPSSFLFLHHGLVDPRSVQRQCYQFALLTQYLVGKVYRPGLLLDAVLHDGVQAGKISPLPLSLHS